MERYRGLQKYLIVSFICVLLIACGKTRPIEFSIDYKTPLAPQPQPSLMAGAAMVDITAPPGMPMGGHSLLSCSGEGVRNKLKARVIYIKPIKGRPIALVQVDLKSGSRIVHHKVAELVAGETDIDAGGLLIAGTHTHSAPGNYFDNNTYNYVSSNKKGFEEKYFEFLGEQIAKAVIKAYKNRKPAKIATGCVAIKGVTVNRSFRPYLGNKIKTIINECNGVNASFPTVKDKEKMDKYDAVNHYFHMIRVDCLDDDGSWKPIGVFSNFSCHTNTNPRELNRLYNGDVAAYIERRLESEMKRIYNPSWQPVHAAANYAHGDNNPFYGEGVIESFWDFERVGSFIAAIALECFRKLDGKLTDNIEINYMAKEIDMFKENYIDGIQVADGPKFGLPALGGAQRRGKNSPLSYVPFFAPGWPRWIFTKGKHGHKRTLGPIQYLVFPKKNYPRHVFLQVIRVHDIMLMAVPWEVTYEMGRRISGHVYKRGKEAGLDKVEKYIAVSCANGYFGYVTTAEEYTLQYYEGASNLYGPNTGKYIKFQLGHMVEELAANGTRTELPEEGWIFKLRAAKKSFYPPKIIPKGKRKIKEDPVYHPGKYRDEASWSFKWYDVPPYSINFHQPLVSIEVSSDNKAWESLIIDGEPVDDNGSNISIHCLKKNAKKNMGLYQTRWYNPPRGNGKFYRFVIQPRKGQKIFYSDPFTSDDGK